MKTFSSFLICLILLFNLWLKNNIKIYQNTNNINFLTKQKKHFNNLHFYGSQGFGLTTFTKSILSIIFLK